MDRAGWEQALCSDTGWSIAKQSLADRPCPSQSHKSRMSPPASEHLLNRCASNTGAARSTELPSTALMNVQGE